MTSLLNWAAEAAVRHGIDITVLMGQSPWEGSFPVEDLPALIDALSALLDIAPERFQPALSTMLSVAHRALKVGQPVEIE